ncbi:MAG: DUF4388 domain-containing protein [Acidimicrobiia bacterium]
MRPIWLPRISRQGGLEVALSGNLGFVPLDEVLRLLMRSDQRGSVDVRGEDIRGRIFVGKKGISLATTAEDRDLHKHLVNSGYVDDGFLRRVATGESSFTDLGDREVQVIELIREITIESLYHLHVKGATFEVAEGATSPYSSPRPFELEAILDDSRRRAEEWAGVHKVIGDLESTIRMNRDPGDREEIRINREAWRLLSELGAGASVRLMAERLGTTEFWIAKVAAEMADQELLVLSGDDVEDVLPETPAATAPASDDRDHNQSWWIEPEDDDSSPEVAEAPPADAGEPPAAEEGGQPGEPEPASRFGHFVKAASPEPGFAPPADSLEPPAAEEEPSQGEEYSNAPAFEPAADVVEEDTEAFLEKVFSQLEVNGQADVEEEGHGLLRRRRMGSVLKEIDED